MQPLTPLTRVVLQADGLSSLFIALASLAMAQLESEVSGLPRALVLGSAVLLAPYGLAAFFVGRRKQAPGAALSGLIGFNLAWATVSLGLLARGGFAPTSFGVALLFANTLVPLLVGVTVLVSQRRERGATAPRRCEPG